MSTNSDEDPVAIARRLTAQAFHGKANVSEWFSTIEFESEESSWSDPIRSEQERLKRLAMARSHLDRVLRASNDHDKVANFDASVIMYWSAVDRVPIANPIWESVRSSILHEDRIDPNELVAICTPSSAGHCLGHYRTPLPEDDRLPKTKSGAFPIVDYRRLPECKYCRWLYWDIRRARRFISISMLGAKREQFLSWEGLMSNIAVDIACNWNHQEAICHAELIKYDELSMDDIEEVAPANYAAGWRGLETLLTQTEGFLRDWFWDEIGHWAIANRSLFESRLNRRDRMRTALCELHCDRAGWSQNRPICEVRGFEEKECDEWVDEPKSTEAAIRAALEPFLGNNLKRLNSSNIPPHFVL